MSDEGETVLTSHWLTPTMQGFIMLARRAYGSLLNRGRACNQILVKHGDPSYHEIAYTGHNVTFVWHADS